MRFFAACMVFNQVHFKVYKIYFIPCYGFFYNDVHYPVGFEKSKSKLQTLEKTSIGIYNVRSNTIGGSGTKVNHINHNGQITNI